MIEFNQGTMPIMHPTIFSIIHGRHYGSDYKFASLVKALVFYQHQSLRLWSDDLEMELLGEHVIMTHI